jgi:hypothetical protein
MRQLILTQAELKSIGFKKKIYPSSEPNEENTFGSAKKVTYQIPCLNGYFRFNVSETEYVWYQDINIGNFGNSICLNIVSKSELFIILDAFRVRYYLNFSWHN